MTKNEFTKFYSEYLNSISKQKLNIDLGVRCPFKCAFCQRQWRGPESSLNERLIVSEDLTLDNLKKAKKYFKNLHFCGQISDPMYNKNIFEILEYLNQTHVKTLRISTVADKDADWWRKIYSIAPPHTYWIFGVDGCDQETLEKYRVGANFDSLWNAMKIGVEEFNAIVEWQFIVFRHNEHQVELAHQLAKENKFILQIYKSARWSWWDTEKANVYPPSDEWLMKNESTPKKERYYYGKRMPLPV